MRAGDFTASIAGNGQVKLDHYPQVVLQFDRPALTDQPSPIPRNLQPIRPRIKHLGRQDVTSQFHRASSPHNRRTSQNDRDPHHTG